MRFGNLRVFVVGILAALAVALSQAFVAGALAQQAQVRAQEKVRAIEVYGNQRIDAQTVQIYSRIQKGDSINENLLNEAVKSLFETGLFSDVQIKSRRNNVIISVEENPIINQIGFDGNETIDDDALLEELSLKVRNVFTKARAFGDVQRLTTLYRRAGLFSAYIEPKIVRLPQNRVDVVFEIAEGPKAVVERINFVGNSDFSDFSLRNVIATAESRWWRVWAPRDTYDPDRLEYDKELLRRHYLKNGYVNFRIISAISELAPDGENFYITFDVDEGEKYEFGDIQVNTGKVSLSDKTKKSSVISQSGEIYDANLVDQTIQNLTIEAGRAGFAFAKVEPDITVNDENKTVDLTYNIEQGDRVYIERIEIVGNTRTRDDVIRREFRLAEGDAYNPILINRSRQRVAALNFFSNVEIDEIQGEDPDKVILILRVQEKSTGSLNFSVGYSTSEDVLGSIALTENNLLGKGHFIRLQTALSSKRQQFNFSFTEPYFFGRDMSFGVDAFAVETNQQDESSFSSSQYGGGFRFGFPISEYSRLTTNYNYSYRLIRNVESDAPSAIQEARGVTHRSLIGVGYTYSTVDDTINPTRGIRLSTLGEMAGLGGDTYFFRLDGNANYFIPVGEKFRYSLPSIFEDTILLLRASAGHVVGWNGRKVPILDRYFRGGQNFRGFKQSGIGPREGDESIGGTTYAVGTAELQFSLGIPKELGIKGTFFSDVGTLFGAEEKGDDILDTAKLRMSIGGGVLWDSPLGPLRFDFSEALLKANYDKTELFRFSVGARF